MRNNPLRLITFIFFSLILFYSTSSYASDNSVTEYDGQIETEYARYYLDNRSTLDDMEKIIEHTRLKLIKLLKDSLGYKPDIFVSGSLSEFNKLVGGNFPDWGAAAAIPELKRIVIKSPQKFNLNKSLGELLAHEYAHLVVSQKAWINYPPRWLNEGIAMQASLEWGWSDNLAMSKASVFGQFIPLKDIERMNGFNESKVQVAYAQSYLAVEFINKQYTDSTIAMLLAEIGSGKSYDDALYAVTGMSEDEFEAEFKIYLNQRFNMLSLFMDTILLWLFLAVVVVVGFFIRFKKRREYYKKWEQDEKLHSTDFDYGDPDHPEKIDDDDEPWRG